VQLLVTLVYVAPLYLSPATRPSPTLSRDAPSVIQARVRVVTTSCVGTTIVMLVLMTRNAHTSAAEALRLLGWWPIQIVDVLRSLLLLLLLFAGPLFERGIAQGGWRSWLKGHDLVQSLRGWLGWRNYVVVSIDPSSRRWKRNEKKEKENTKRKEPKKA
jgi:prenyl protein peptidase